MSYSSLGANAPDTVEFTVTPGAAGVTSIAMNLKHGTLPVSGTYPVSVHLSDSPDGEGVTATTASGAVTTSVGAVAATPEAKKALLCAPTATGNLTLSITDTAKTAFFVVVTLPGGLQEIKQLSTEDYGA